MRILKALNNINALALALYIPYIALNFDSFFFGKNKDGGVILISIIMFLTTFICGGIIMIIANKRNVENDISFSEIKSIGKGTFIALVTIYLIGIALMLLFIHSEAVFFYFVVSTISLAFVVEEKILIQRIDTSPTFKITLPWDMYPIPFIVFIGGSLSTVYTIAEENQGKVIIILFITAGIMMAYLAWHGYYAVNTDLNTLEINKGILSFLGGKSVTISLDNIEFVKVKGFYLILILDNDEIKINRFYSGMKKFEKTLDANGIPIKHN